MKAVRSRQTLCNPMDCTRQTPSLPCVRCESLLAEINELKLTHTTYVEQFEHARAENFEMSSRLRSSLSLLNDACHTSCATQTELHDVNDDISSTALICTSCVDLKNEVLALEQMRDDMCAKLVEHNEMSANLEKEIELLRTTYAKCIGEEMKNLRDAPCGTCEGLKFENEVLAKRCKSLCAKSLDSRDFSNSGVVSKIASSHPELSSCAARESLDDSTCAKVLDNSSIATPKPVASSGDDHRISHDKGASYFFGTHVPKLVFRCTFCKKDGHSLEFCFRRVKHERRVRAKAFRKPRDL